MRALRHVRSSWKHSPALAAPPHFCIFVGRYQSPVLGAHGHGPVRSLHASTRIKTGTPRALGTLSFATSCKETTPREPCQHGAFVMSLVPRREGGLGGLSGGDVSICGQSGSVGGRDSWAGPRPAAFFSLLLWFRRAHNLLYCTELYAHEQRMCGRQVFFFAALRRRKPAAEERERESGTEKDSLVLPPSARRPIPTRTSHRNDGAPTQIEE